MTEPTASDIAQQTKVSGKAWGMLAVTYFASICAPLCQFKIPPLASWLFPAFHGALDSVTFGTLMSAIALIGVVLAFPAAFIARRMGLKNVILLSVACLGVGSALGGVDANLTLLLVSRLLEGVGIGLIGVAAPSCVTIWFPERKRGLALGLWATWVPVGSVLAFNTVPMIAGAFGYQTVFFSLAGVCLVAFVLFCAVYRMPEGATSMTTIGIMNTYYNTFLETQLGFDAQTASSLSSIIMFISLFVAPLTGLVSDKLPLGRKYLVGIVMMVLLIPTGFFMFYVGDGATAVMWATIVLQGIGGGMCGGSLRPMAPMLMRNTAMGATMAMAIMQFCQNLGSAIGSPLFGAVMSTQGWEAASFMLQLPAYVLALVLCFFILPRGKYVTSLDDVPADKAWPKGF